MKKKKASRRVDPKVYTKEYYLTGCSGYNEFNESDGNKLEPRFAETVRLFPEMEGKRVLDIGSGRGEIVFYALKQGATEAIGIDYSKDAIDIAKKAQKKQSKYIKSNSKFFVRDAKRTRYKDESFDVVFMLEVLEHLYPEEQEQILKEIHRILRPKGKLFIHTAPSKFFNDYTYKYWCYPISSLFVGLWNMVFDKKYGNLHHPSKIRTELDHVMHVNEPDYFSLDSMFRKCRLLGQIYSTNITIKKPIYSWKDRLYNFLVYLDPLSNYPPFNIIWGNDFYATLTKNE